MLIEAMDGRSPAPDTNERERFVDASMPSLTALRAFEAIGSTGGLRRAARYLRVDHAVVSRHLRSLEVAVGVALVDRNQAGGRLTPAGQHYHQRVAAAFAEISAATAELKAEATSGEVRLWCAPGIASRWLARTVSNFCAAHDGIAVQVQPTDGPPNFAIRQATADIRYIYDWDVEEPDVNDVRRVELARPVTLAVASPDFLAQHDEIHDASQLLKLPLLHRKSDQPWRAWLTAHGIEVPAVLKGVRLWQAHLTIEAARNGQGVTLANRFTLADDLQSGALVQIGIGQPVRQGAYYFFARSDEWDLRPLAILRRWLLDAVRETHLR